MRFHQPVGVLQRNTAASQLGHNNYNNITQNNGNHTEILNILTTTITGGGTGTRELGFQQQTTNALTATPVVTNHNNLTTESLTNNYNYDNDNNDDTTTTNCITITSNNRNITYTKNSTKFDGKTDVTNTNTLGNFVDEHISTNIRNNYNNYQVNNINESYNLLLQNQRNQQQKLNSNEVIDNQTRNRFIIDNCNLIDETDDRNFDEDSLNHQVS